MQALSSDATWGQTFSHNSGLGQYTVNQLSLVMYRASDAPAQDITVTLRTAWNASVVATATISSDTLSTTHAWTAFDFGDVSLTDNVLLHDPGYQLLAGWRGLSRLRTGRLCQRDHDRH